MNKQLERKACEAFQSVFSNHPEMNCEFQCTLLSNGSAMVHIPVIEAINDPAFVLRSNLASRIGCCSAPVVIDHMTGQCVKRCLIPYHTWANPRRLKELLIRNDTTSEPDHSRLKLQLNIPVNMRSEYRYGRGGRMSVILNQQTAVLAVRIFPGWATMKPELLSKTKEAALVLMARSGVTSDTFHVMRTPELLGVERAICIPETTVPDRIKTLEKLLITFAEEDRLILHAMCSQPIALQTLLPV